jgi:Arc/MetJ family transcription regulator
MSRTIVELDDEALALASEELGTTSKVATVNAALRRVANQRAAARMLELLDETDTGLSDEALRGEARKIWRHCSPVSGHWSGYRSARRKWTGRWRSSDCWPSIAAMVTGVRSRT